MDSTGTPNTKERDRQRFSRLAALLIATAATGYLTFFVSRATVWEQWSYLVHALQGVILSALIIQYVYFHYRRTVGLRRAAVSVTGIVAVLVATAFIGTGMHIVIFGQFEAARGIYWAHVVVATAVLVVVVGHVFVHRYTQAANRREPGESLFTLQPQTRRQMRLQLAAAGAVIVAGSACYALLPSPYRDNAAVEPYEHAYGADPFTPSHNRTASGGFYDVKRLGGAARCGACHEEIYAEWKSSIHSKAAEDRAYQTNVNLLASKKGMAATRYCEGCHAPVPMMSGQLTKGGRLDTPGHLQEGVTCLTCHAMRRVLDTSGVASYLYDPPASYLFEGYDNAVARQMHNYLLRLNPDLHRRDMARPPLRTPELCATCHAQFMEKVMNDWGWVKMQDDYTAWLKGPFSAQLTHTFAQSTAQRCQDCHFGLVPGHDPSANTQGLQRSHRLPGANTAIPFIEGDTRHLEYITRFLQANRVTVTIDKPTRPQPLRSGQHVQADISDFTKPPANYYLGDDVTIHTVVSNVGVGHDFPGGTADINEAWVHFTVTDAQDHVIYESGAVREDGTVDPAAYFYRQLAVDKQGKLVWRHDLFRMVGDSYKNVIKPGAADVVTYNFRLPSWAKAPITVSAVVCYRKLNIRYARWALKDEKLVLPIVDVASDAIVLPIRERQEAQDTAPAAALGPGSAPAAPSGLISLNQP